MRRQTTKSSMAASIAHDEVETCKDSVASAEVSSLATTESKVEAGHDDAYFGILAGEEVKPPLM